MPTRQGHIRKNRFIFVLSTLTDVRAPICAPVKMPGATTSAIFQSGCPAATWPRKPPVAVRPTINAELPMAIFIGTPKSNTIIGTLRIPPEAPTRPLIAPTINDIGSARARLTQYSPFQCPVATGKNLPDFRRTGWGFQNTST